MWKGFVHYVEEVCASHGGGLCIMLEEVYASHGGRLSSVPCGAGHHPWRLSSSISLLCYEAVGAGLFQTSGPSHGCFSASLHSEAC